VSWRSAGDAPAQELGVERVTVEDEYGRDPALRFRGTTVLAFPLTMIVAEMFGGVCEHVRRMKNDPEYRGIEREPT
jgi:hypothetical protein